MKTAIMRRTQFFILISALLILIPFSLAQAKVLDTTREEAEKWLTEQKGKTLEYDNSPEGSATYAQCVDLIGCYYKFLGLTQTGGNACDYAVNNLPDGAIRIPDCSQPQFGDILVYLYPNTNGHVAIYESDYVTWHQNLGGNSYVERVVTNENYKTAFYYNYELGMRYNYWGVIRPLFADSTSNILTITTLPNGSGSVSASVNGSNISSGGKYAEGEQIDLRATPSEGYLFDKWTSSNGGTFTFDGLYDWTTFTMPANATTVTANFKLPSITEWCNVTATALRGPDARLSGRVKFASDRKAVEVGCWLGTDESEVMMADGNGLGGSASVYKASNQVASGIAAQTGDGYRYIDVSFTATGKNTQSSATVADAAGFGLPALEPETKYYYKFYVRLDDGTCVDSTVGSSTAGTFQSLGSVERTLTVAATVGGTLGGSYSGKYVAGETITLSAQANTGYKFSHWNSDYADWNGSRFDNITSATGCVFTMPDADTAVTACFIRKAPTEKYTLTIQAGEGGEIVSGIPGVYGENATVSMTAKAKKGYSFLKWESTAGTFTNPYDQTTLFAMTSSDAVVTARFVPDSTSITLTPETTNFGKVDQASLAVLVYQRVAVTNNGSRAVTLVPKSGLSFTFEDQKAFHLEAGESASLYVHASSTLTPGTYSETLNIETSEGRVAGSLAFSIEVTKASSGVSFLTVSPFKGGEFGTWYVGSELPAARTFTVRYVGEGSVQLEQTVEESAYFEISALSKTTLSANETATFTIRPKGNIPLGYHTVSVEIKGKSDSIGELLCGQTASIHVKQGAVAASPLRLDFAALPVGYAAPAVQKVTITNIGNLLLDLDMSKLVSTYYNVAAVDHPEWTLGTREILEGCSMQFSVQPKTGLPAGTYSETLRFPLETENGMLVVTIPLSFTVGNSVDSGIDLNLKNLNFGAVEPYQNMTPPNAQTLWVTNTNDRELVLARPTATYFTVTASSYTIAPQGNIQLDVQPKQGLAPGRYEEDIPLTVISAIASQNSGNLRAGSNSGFSFKASYEVLPYRLVSGDNEQYAVDGEKDAEVVCNGDPNQLAQFLFGGLDITAKVKIESVNGRTKVTIPVGVLNNFPAGTYTLTFVYRDGGRITARLTIGTQATAENTPPQTGDKTPIVFYIALTLMAIMCGICVVRTKRSCFRKR